MPGAQVPAQRPPPSTFATLYKLISLLFENYFEWFYSFFSNRSALERLLDVEVKHRAKTMMDVERWLTEKRVNAWQRLREGSLSVEEHFAEERVRCTGARREQMIVTFTATVGQLKAYDALIAKVIAGRAEKYDPTNKKHEKKLLKLWSLLMPQEELSDRISKQWTFIGFQGKDPATDFRGMGILGLDQLLFFAQFDVDNVHAVLTLSHHPVIGFPFAVAGITFTALCCRLLEAGLLKRHFYNAQASLPDFDAFNRVYCKVFVLFSEYWKVSDPESVMMFNPVLTAFEQSLRTRLARDDANLNFISVDDL